MKKPFLFLMMLALCPILASAQTSKQQKGLLWQITGNGLKKPSYLYGTMHVSQKIAFHLGDSFYLALSKSDVIALEQNLDSVIHQWITDNDFDKPEDANKVYQRSSQDYLTTSDFTLSSYNKRLLKSKLSEEAREVNYLLTRGEQGDFEENAWLDLYIYQIARKLGKGFTGVEGFQESRDLVKKAQKEPKDAKKKTINFSKSYKLRQQVADAYRKGDIYMIDSIDRMTESDHYREYMLYKRNANMARRMDSIMHLGKTMFTGVGCSHLPGDKGVIQMLMDKGYQLRPVQSIALEKSSMAKKYEDMTVKHKYQAHTSADGLITAILPTKLSMVNNNSDYTSYFSPDLANGYYYQIEKIACNTIFSGKTPDDILLDIDTMIFENIPGEITSKNQIFSNGFNGMEVITQLKTGDLNRFQIIASPFNVYIIRLSGKDKFAVSSDANKFFKTLKINEGNAHIWKRTQSYDSIFSIELPTATPDQPLKADFLSDASYEHIVYDKSSGNTYMIKQVDKLNEDYLEHDSFELHVMARSFASTDKYEIVDTKTFNLQGYAAMDAQFINQSQDPIYARMVLCGTRYILFVCKPMINYLEGLPRGNNNNQGFNDRFFSSIQFNGKPKYQYFDYKDTHFYYSVKTSVMPTLCKESNYDYGMWGNYEEADEAETKEQDKYQGKYKEMYFKNQNANEFITVGCYSYGYYENQMNSYKKYIESWKKKGSLKCLSAKQYKRNGVDYYLYSYNDTNTSRIIKELSALRGNRRYSVVAYLDTVSGNSEFVSNFINSFDVSDTLINDSIFKPKGYRFIADFSSKDSTRRKAAIKYYYTVNFTKQDLPHIYNIIDTISNKGEAAELRSNLIDKIAQIDSAQDLIAPYLSKLYKRFNDTAYLQIKVLTAMARVKSLKSYQNIKPILSQDMPISDNASSMEAILYPFYDSLKLTKNILNELIELTSIPEYRITAYDLISRMKDSGIINENDYLPLHDKLVKETKIEYKRMMASVTNLKVKNDYNSFDYYAIDGESVQDWGEDYSYDYSTSYTYRPVLNSLLDLTLPLRSKNTSMNEIATKLCNINDNELRLSLMPVLLKYKLSFHDTVYEALAKNNKTRTQLYDILESSKQLDKFPKAYSKQSEMVIGAFYNYKSYSKIDTVEILYTQKVIIGNDSGLVYVCRYKLEDDADYSLYMSESMPCDTNALNTTKTPRVFYITTNTLDEEDNFEQMVKKNFFENLLSIRRYKNGGYYTPEYDYDFDGLYF